MIRDADLRWDSYHEGQFVTYRLTHTPTGTTIVGEKTGSSRHKERARMLAELERQLSG